MKRLLVIIIPLAVVLGALVLWPRFIGWEEQAKTLTAKIQ